MKDNVNYGISPDDDINAVMADIEKNIEEEKISGTFGKDEDKEYIDPRIEGLENVGDLARAQLDDVEEEKTVSQDISDKKEEEEDKSLSDADIFREKYYQEKKKRKGVYADRQKLEQENQELKKILSGTINSNSELYKKGLVSDLEKIKSIRKQALLGEDPDLLLDADELYYKTLIKLEDFEKQHVNSSKNIENVSQPVEKQVVNDDFYNEEAVERAKEWLDTRPELVEGSTKYNPVIQKAVGAFVEKLDRDLKKAGRANEILSEDYLDTIDEFVDKIKAKPVKTKYSTTSVGSVRNNFSNGSTTSIKLTLEPWEKDYAKNLGISEKEYLKYKYEDLKEQRNSRR